jgi:hypothetical protein
VELESMLAALQIGQWLTDETLRVYDHLEFQDQQAVSPTQRFLKQFPDRFETSEARQITEKEEIPEIKMYD